MTTHRGELSRFVRHWKRKKGGFISILNSLGQQRKPIYIYSIYDN